MDNSDAAIDKSWILLRDFSEYKSRFEQLYYVILNDKSSIGIEGRSHAFIPIGLQFRRTRTTNLRHNNDDNNNTNNIRRRKTILTFRKKFTYIFHL